MYEVNAQVGGLNVLLVTDNIFALEEFLNNRSAGTWATDTVLLHSVTKFLIIDGLARRFHSAKESSLGIVFGRSGGLLYQLGFVRT